MIKKVINTFYTAARQHKLVNSFAYAIPSKIVGRGEDKYPMVTLEEPVRFTGSPDSPMNELTVNLTVTTNEDKPSFENQDKCEMILYQLTSFIREFSKEPFNIESIDVVTLSKYNDDATDGVRATIRLAVRTDYSICTSEFFDETKEFDADSPLPVIGTSDAEGCGLVFDTKLPVF